MPRSQHVPACALVALVMAVLAVPNPTAMAGPVPPRIEVTDGVRHVYNGDVPLQGERSVTLEERWRVNAEDEEELIGVISAAISGPDGEVWLADNQLGQILVYSATGMFLRTVSREGEGPGEISQPSDLFWLPDGSLGIADRKMGQFTHVDSHGMPLPSIHLEDSAGSSLGTCWLQRVRCRGGRLAVCGNKFGNRDDGTPVQTRFFGLFDLDGREVVRLRDKPSGFDFGARTFDEQQNWFVEQGQMDLDADGRVYFADERDAYRILVHDAAGVLVTVIERSYEQRRRTADERERMHGRVTMSINGETVRLDSEFLETAPAIERLQILDDGSLWVVNGHGTQRGSATGIRSFDVFDREGRFQEVVHATTDVDEEQDRLWRLDDGRWILVKNLTAAWRTMSPSDEDDDAQDADAALEIICLQGR